MISVPSGSGSSFGSGSFYLPVKHDFYCFMTFQSHVIFEESKKLIFSRNLEIYCQREKDPDPDPLSRVRIQGAGSICHGSRTLVITDPFYDVPPKGVKKYCSIMMHKTEGY
jgi:hypothetical protein